MLPKHSPQEHDQVLFYKSRDYFEIPNIDRDKQVNDV
jgi:hypothetical protein